MTRKLSRRLASTMMFSLPFAALGMQRAMGQNRDILITNGWLPAGPDSPFTLAMDRGFFQENGLNVTIERGAGSADALSKLAAGRYAFSKGDMYSMMEFNEKNPEVPLIAVVIESNRHPGGIFTLKKNGITDPKQLAGVKIGAPAGDGARRLWPVLANIIGMDPDSVEWVNCEPALREPLLARGEVQAISGFGPSVVPSLQRLGISEDELEVFYFNDYGLNLYGPVVMSRLEYVKSNPDIARGFVAGYVRGLVETIKDPVAAFATLPKHFEGADALDQDTELTRLKYTIANYWDTPDTRANGVSAVDLQRLQTSLAQVAEGYGLQRVPDASEILTTEFLPPKEVRMFA